MAREPHRKSSLIDLKTVDRRDALRPRAGKAPYWCALSSGRYLGFRPSTIGGAGAWLARYYDPDTHKRPCKRLGDFGTLAPSKRYDAAKHAAEAWFDHLSQGGSHRVLTVRQACERYAQDKPDARARFGRYLYDDPIAAVTLTKLNGNQVQAWRKRLAALPALITRNKRGVKATRQRTDSTINRDMTCFRAALNAAFEQGDTITDRAWRVALKPIKAADRRRDIYLDREQRRALLDHLPMDAADFARGLCALPLRPGALAALTVADFNTRTSTLKVGKDKSGKDRHILLPEATAKMLHEQARRKLPAAPLFACADGSAWDRDKWKGPIKAAVRAAGLPDSASAYTLRHSTITDLVDAGVPTLTVAQIAGTSVAMIEKHYGHLRQKAAAAALATLVL
ncbi:MAG: tyrosine-type recombinase/integrase [Proteobacteria bacterium]|nr:tyrosine-type recombinase/integrase [Pseudomonadota bacterium]